jgi:hypothetical protein
MNLILLDTFSLSEPWALITIWRNQDPFLRKSIESSMRLVEQVKIHGSSPANAAHER